MFTTNMHQLMRLSWFANTYNQAVSGFRNAEGTTFNGYANNLCYAGPCNAAKYLRAETLTAFSGSSGYISGVGKGLYLGAGSTPATINDYKLETPITAGLRIVGSGNEPVLEHIEDGIYSYAYAFSVTNTSGSEINISELGLFVPLCASNNKDVSNFVGSYHSVMIKRDVLTEPITIAPGATKVINYKLTFNQTLNVD